MTTGSAPTSVKRLDTKRERIVNIEFVLLGGSPLLCHNPIMVDPQCEWTIKIKAITGKRKKTEEDLKEIELLEWYGGIYTGDIGGRPVVTQPASKVRKCLINAAKISKQGKQIERAIIMTELNVPLIYDGSDRAGDLAKELDRLQRAPAHNSRLSVGIGNKRVMRVRPQFMPWALVVPAVYVPDAGLNFDELERIVELAGQAERIGDNRVNGYGAFRGVVRPTDGTKTPPIKPTIEGVRSFFAAADKAA